MIPIAKNKRTGQPVSARAAYIARGEEYECLSCGVPLIPKKSPKGNYYFCCKKNMEHKPGCRMVELYRSRDFPIIDEININIIAERIMGPKKERRGGNGGGGPGAPHPNVERTYVPDTLKHLYCLCLGDERNFRLNEGCHLRDIMITSKTSACVDMSKDLGYRAIVAKPGWYDRSTKTIYFRVFSARPQEWKMNRCVYVFALEYDLYDNSFDVDVDRLFYCGKPIYKEAWIFGEWFLLDSYSIELIKRQYESGKWPIFNIWTSTCKNPSDQIYINQSMLIK